MFDSGEQKMRSSFHKHTHKGTSELFISSEKTFQRRNWQHMSPRGCCKCSLFPIKAPHCKIYAMWETVSEWGEFCICLKDWLPGWWTRWTKGANESRRRKVDKDQPKKPDDMIQWNEAWGTGSTEPQKLPGEEKAEPHLLSISTKLKFCHEQWEPLCEKIRIRIRIRIRNMKDGKWEPGCVSIYCFIHSPVSDSSFNKHNKTMTWWWNSNNTIGTISGFILNVIKFGNS